MGFIGRLKFNRRFFAGLLVVLVVFGVFGKDVVYVNYKHFCSCEHVVLAAEGDNLGPPENAGFWQSYWYWFKRGNSESIDDALVGTEYDSGGVGEEDGPSLTLNIGPWLIQKASGLVMWTVSSDLYDGVFFSEGARRVLSFIWGVVRDFVNMFYLLILIFLAITTILRVNKFSDKKLFFNVIVSAILVNFSLPIALAVIDFSNMLMDFFATAITNTLHGKDIGTFMLSYSHYSTSISLMNLIRSGAASIAQFVIEVAMAVMLFFTAISLLIRLVAYWVLIILSPLAFFSIALPNSDGFREWKDKLLNYSFYGPIMLFFIWIALLLLAELGTILATVNSASKWTTGESGKWLAFIVPYITVMYLLYYGHDKSKSMAAKAGDTVTKIMDRGKDYAVKAGKGAAIATPLGGLGYLGYQYGKSRGKAEYVGMKTAMESGKYGKIGKLLTKKGREKEQEEVEFRAKMRYAKKSQKDKLRMEEIYKTKKELQDKGVNLNDRDYILNLLDSGTDKEKRMAANIAAEKGWLKGDAYAKAMKIAGDNELLKSSINATAGNKNKFAVFKYNLDNYKQNPEKIKYIKDKLKKVMNESEIDNFLSEVDDDEIKRRTMFGIMKGMNTKGMADFINEEDGVAPYAKDYLMDGGGGFTEDGLEEMFNDLKSENARTILRPVLVSGNFTANGGQRGRIFTGRTRASSRRENPRGGNFNGVLN